MRTTNKTTTTFLKKEFGVFAILNKVNNKVFIGTGELFKRKAINWSLLKSGRHFNQSLQKEWIMFGEPNFEFIALYECKEVGDLAFLHECESYWILLTKSTDKHFGYNIYKKPSNTNEAFAVRIQAI